MNGNRAAVTGFAMAAVSAAATAAWSNAGAFVPRTASTSRNSFPLVCWLRYQNRSSGNQVARTAPFETSGVVL